MSIPTSLIVVFLAAAWLAVLVPMVARRREVVPETESDSGTFRVLRRASVSMRQRPTAGRRHDLEEDDIDDVPVDRDVAELPGDAELDEELLDDESDDRDLDEDFDEDDVVDDDVVDDARDGDLRGRSSGQDDFGRDDSGQADFGDEYSGEQDLDSAESQAIAAHTQPDRFEPAPVIRRAGSSRWRRPAAEPAVAVEQTPVSEHAGSSRWRRPAAHPAVPLEEAPVQLSAGPVGRPVRRGMSHRFEPASGVAAVDYAPEVDESRLRPIPRRPGRGGFDPEAAEAARKYRYSRRRRVTVVLLLATIVCAVVAYFLQPMLWIGAAVCGLLLVAYLAYLRRQVRIEADIRDRRLARLRRARQIRPEYDLDRASTSTATGAHAVPYAPGPVPQVQQSQVPPTGYRRGRQVVDLDDDDPSFDDLEYYEPVVYRRASGQ